MVQIFVFLIQVIVKEQIIFCCAKDLILSWKDGEQQSYQFLTFLHHL